jgi:hypothetical protein
MHHARITRFAIPLALAAAMALLGCSHLSVRHLNRQPWSLDSPRTLELKVFSFEYQAAPQKDSFIVDGVARPNPERVPPWADWLDELWLAAYLCDYRGIVLAKDLRLYPPQELPRGEAIHFTFNLEPQELESGSLFVTFGYRVTLLDAPGQRPDKNSKDRDRQVFFASESAVTLF